MAEESDGMNDAVEGHLVIAVTLATRAAETLAQIVAERAREAATASQAQARQLTARLDAERAAARASVEGVGGEQWWARAQPEQIAAAWQTTQTWKGLDPDLAATGREIASQLQARYGIDVDQVRPDPQALREALAARQGAQQQDPGAQRTKAGREGLEAVVLVSEADAADRQRQSGQVSDVQASGQVADVQASGQVAYDSAARREATAERLGKIADPETVRAVMLADLAQARPAREAVATKPSAASLTTSGRSPKVLAPERVKTLGR